MIEPLTLEAARHVCDNVRESDRRELEAMLWPGQGMATIAEHAMFCSPTAWCASLDDEPVAVVACGPIHPGVWQVGAFATDRFPEVVFPLTKFIVRGIIPALIAAGAHRAHAYSLADHVDAHRWLELTGAVKEATLKGLGREQEDFELYVWRSENVRAAKG